MEFGNQLFVVHIPDTVDRDVARALVHVQTDVEKHTSQSIMLISRRDDQLTTTAEPTGSFVLITSKADGFEISTINHRRCQIKRTMSTNSVVNAFREMYLTPAYYTIHSYKIDSRSFTSVTNYVFQSARAFPLPIE